MLIKLLAKLTGGKRVILEDSQKELYYSIAYPHPFDKNNMFAYVYPITKVGFVLLLPDGNVDPRSRSGYIKRWKFI